MLHHPFRTIAAILLLGWTSLAVAAQLDANVASGSIERRYKEKGPSATLRNTSSKACDSKGNPCDIWYPADIGKGEQRAALLWANGTFDGAVGPEIYDYLLSHLASWGFVVIATRDGKTGYGDTVLDTLAFLRKEAEDRNSPLYRRIDFDRVGVAGHSQGATGAINAMLKSKGKVRTSVAFQLPRQLWCSPADLCVLTPDLQAATSGSIFYVGGTFDFLISPDKQLGGNMLNSLTAYYDATPSRLLKAKGLVKLANHNDILGKPDCGTAEVGGSPLTCTLGVYGYLGLPTAWLAWQLQGAKDAGRAFRKGKGEFFSANAWSGQVSNIP